MVTSHHRHALFGTAEGSDSAGFLPVSELEAPAEAKLHVPHMHSLRATLVDPVILASRQFRISTVPAPVLAIGCLLAFLAGTYINTAEMLPAPGGPTVGSFTQPSANKVPPHSPVHSPHLLLVPVVCCMPPFILCIDTGICSSADEWTFDAACS